MDLVNPPASRTYVLMPLPRRLDDSAPSAPASDAVFLPLYVGGGGDNLLCGECFLVLGQCVELENLRDRLLLCPRCGRENAISKVGDLRALGQELDSSLRNIRPRPIDQTEAVNPE